MTHVWKSIARVTFAALLLTWLPAAGRAEIGDPTLRTDHPQYAGEGAFQTVEDCVRFATAGRRQPQQRALALYNWILTHQWHLVSPQEWLVPGEVPDSSEVREDLVVYDANRGRFSYGFGLCGTVHAWNEPYWRALGMAARRRGFPGHTNSEIRYGDAWHTFDTDMAGLIFRKDGIVAGYDDVVADPQCANRQLPGVVCYPFAWPGDWKAMRDGWGQIAKGGNWIAMYNAGYAAQPGVVHLRRGETFTRYFDRDHYGGPSKRRFWYNQAGGPFRDWTFANQGPPRHDGAESNARGNASYCNGEFVYRPDLSKPAYREGIVEQSENVAAQSQSPSLYSRDGKPASVTFAHWSPYVICGDPVDDADPMTGEATDGLVVEGRTAGEVRIELSSDQGQTWHTVGSVERGFRLDLTERAKGRYGWRVRFTWSGKAGLDELRFTTTTQVCQAIYPRLKSQGSKVTWKAAGRAVVPVVPNLGLAQDRREAVSGRPVASENLASAPRSKSNRLAWRTTNNKPATVTFQVDSPTELAEISAAVRFSVRVPPPKEYDFRLEVSTDGGQSWEEFARAEIPQDNELSSGWMYGTADVSAAKSRTALVRAHLYAGGYTTGLIAAEVYGLRKTPAAQVATLTYAWKEGDKLHTHVEPIPAAATEHTFTVPTGKNVVDAFVRMEAK